MRNNQKGFTLIELLIYIAITSIVCVAIVHFYSATLNNGKKNTLLTEMYQNARTSVYFLENELRMAGYSPNRHESWAASVPTLDTGLTTTDDHAVAFTYVADEDGYDNDGDNTVDNPDEIAKVKFYLSGEDLIREAELASGNIVEQVIASGIDSLDFAYTPIKDNSTNVHITIVAKTSKNMPGRKSVADRAFTTNVKCRNVGL